MGYKVFLTDDINLVELDTEDIDVKSVYALLDITDIVARKGNIKSIQFKGTKTNNYAFGTIFDLGRTSDFNDNNKLLFNYNPLRSVTTLVYEDSELIFKGSLRISDIDVDRFGNVVYNTVLTSSFLDLKNVLQDKFLTDIDFNNLTHTYDYNNIVAS